MADEQDDGWQPTGQLAGEDEGWVDVSEEQDGGLLKRITVEGKGEEKPTSGSSVTVHYTGTLQADGSKFDSSRDRNDHFVFDVGIGQVIRGWDVGILTMKRGERCVLRCKAHYGYGDHGSPPTIPGGATLDFDVELFKWQEKVREPNEMNPDERAEFAAKKKEEGTAAFQRGDFEEAAEAYSDGARYITHAVKQAATAGACASHDQRVDEFLEGKEDAFKDAMQAGGKREDVSAEGQVLSEEERKLAMALLNNCAMARLKTNEPDLAKFECTKALVIEPGNVKALFRRAQAKLALQDWDGAKDDAAKAVELDPENKEAEKLRARILAEKKKARDKDKAMCAKMFG